MTLRHMIIFRAICENGYNSTKAAEMLHMTQPAVSLAIKELEQYYLTFLEGVLTASKNYQKDLIKKHLNVLIKKIKTIL